MIQLRPFVLALFFVVPWVTSQEVCAWSRPESPIQGSLKAPSNPAGRLESILLEVNGEPRMVRVNEELSVIRGDKIRVREAYLYDRSMMPKEVQVVGLMRTRQGQAESRGVEFRTKDLASRQSEGGKGQVYAVVVRSKKDLHGTAFLKIQDAALRYAEVSVNQTKRILRDGEPLKLSSKDLFKLHKIVTNLDHDDGVIFQIADGSRGERAIRFLRYGVAFATIPLIIEE